MPGKLQGLLRVPKLTLTRIGLALAVAVAADGLQFCTGPLGWAGIDEVIDVVTMVLTSWLIGFHILMLPTFVVEMVPLVDDLPTWTACVLAVSALRRREQKREQEKARIGEISVPEKPGPGAS